MSDTPMDYIAAAASLRACTDPQKRHAADVIDELFSYAVLLREALTVLARDAAAACDTTELEPALFQARAALAKNPNPAGSFTTEASTAGDNVRVQREASGPVGLGPLPNVRRWTSSANDSIEIRFARDLTPQEMDAIPKMLVALMQPLSQCESEGCPTCGDTGVIPTGDPEFVMQACPEAHSKRQ